MNHLEAAIQRVLKRSNNDDNPGAEMRSLAWNNAQWKKGDDWKYIINGGYLWSSKKPPIAVTLVMNFRGRGSVKVSLDAYTMDGKNKYKNIYKCTMDEHHAIANVFLSDKLGMMDEEYCRVGVSFKGLSQDVDAIRSNGELIIEFNRVLE